MRLCTGVISKSTAFNKYESQVVLTLRFADYLFFTQVVTDHESEDNVSLSNSEMRTKSRIAPTSTISNAQLTGWTSDDLSGT